MSGTYLIKYILLFNRASALSATQELYLKKGWPLVCCYKVASLGDLRFVLAPKVDVDEDDDDGNEGEEDEDEGDAA